MKEFLTQKQIHKYKWKCSGDAAIMMIGVANSNWCKRDNTRKRKHPISYNIPSPHMTSSIATILFWLLCRSLWSAWLDIRKILTLRGVLETDTSTSSTPLYDIPHSHSVWLQLWTAEHWNNVRSIQSAKQHWNCTIPQKSDTIMFASNHTNVLLSNTCTTFGVARLVEQGRCVCF